MKQKYSNDVL